jgi:hypothetical protein
MSFTKELRSWFFRTGAPTNTEGKKINLEDGSRPDQDVFEKMTASHLNFKEAADRAKTNTGAAIEAEVGTVAVTSDVKAKANTTGFEADRTLVTHAGQLPTVDVGADQAITGTEVPLTSTPFIDVTADATSTRNNFVVTITSTLLGWYQAVSDWIDAAQTSIDTNTSDISSINTTLSTTGSLIAEEEGVTVGTTTKTINFVGAGVTATDAGGNETTVTIPSSATTVTYDEVLSANVYVVPTLSDGSITSMGYTTSFRYTKIDKLVTIYFALAMPNTQIALLSDDEAIGVVLESAPAGTLNVDQTFNFSYRGVCNVRNSVTAPDVDDVSVGVKSANIRVAPAGVGGGLEDTVLIISPQKSSPADTEVSFVKFPGIYRNATGDNLYFDGQISYISLT